MKRINFVHSSFYIALVLSFMLVGTQTFIWAATSPVKDFKFAEKLSKTRKQIYKLEKILINGSKGRKKITGRIKNIRKLIKLKRDEKKIGESRIQRLEDFIKQLEKRRVNLKVRIESQKKMVRTFLMEIDRSEKRAVQTLPYYEQEKIEIPKRQILSKLVSRALRQIETIRIDIADADVLENQISREKEQLVFVFQELKEQESVLNFHKQVELDALRREFGDRMERLKSYQALKKTEGIVEALIGQFNARVEFEKIADTEKSVAKSMYSGSFAAQKGHLRLPIAGKIIAQFGRHFDTRSRLKVFKKGVDIKVGKNEPVRSIHSGKIAYNGVIPRYGKVVIIDHGSNYYTLSAHLGKSTREVGNFVKGGDIIGMTDEKASPIYFEIRSKNVAVNPLQWVTL